MIIRDLTILVVFVVVTILFERIVWNNTSEQSFLSATLVMNKADLDELIMSRKLICNDAWEVIETETTYKYRCGTFFPFNTNIVIKKGE